MKFVLAALSFSLACLAGPAHAADTAQAGSTCDSQAVDKKLAGAAKTSFLKKCNADMAAAAPNAAVCDSQAAEKKLAGAAKASFIKKCQREAGVNPGVQCDAQAADKKLAGAAKASFLKKCVADAKG